MNQMVAESPTQQAVMEDSMAIRVLGQALTELPKDLYIPPEALQIFLETFEGPLDLLLYLIKKQNIDILDIPIVNITKQYMQYIDVMHELKIELAAEYLVMAATLAEIKSRLLLPKPSQEDDEESGEDPRAELVRRLQDYERFKAAAENIDALPRCQRDVFIAQATPPAFTTPTPEPDVSMDQLWKAFRDVMQRAKLYARHQVGRELLSIRERMTRILGTINAQQFTEFHQLFSAEEGRMGVVVTFIAILELTRQSVLELAQSSTFGPIYVKSRQDVAEQQLAAASQAVGEWHE